MTLPAGQGQTQESEQVEDKSIDQLKRELSELNLGEKGTTKQDDEVDLTDEHQYYSDEENYFRLVLFGI